MEERVRCYGASVGEVLVALRKARGLTQSGIAGAVGVAASTWCRIEQGRSAFTVEQLERAAGALAVAPAELLRQADARHRRGGRWSPDVRLTRSFIVWGESFRKGTTLRILWVSARKGHPLHCVDRRGRSIIIPRRWTRRAA
jgi:transcriptional regulator with XRE-family HTH domain